MGLKVLSQSKEIILFHRLVFRPSLPPPPMRPSVCPCSGRTTASPPPAAAHSHPTKYGTWCCCCSSRFVGRTHLDTFRFICKRIDLFSGACSVPCLLPCFSSCLQTNQNVYRLQHYQQQHRLFFFPLICSNISSSSSWCH